MTIESGIEDPTSYIDTLNDTYPAATDQKSEGDNHIRGIKNCIVNTFPSITGVINATHTEINTVCDGSTASTPTTVTGADNLILNDAGTMVQIDVDDLDTYFAQTTKTLTNKTLTSPVVNSPTGIVKGDVGLGNVDNTADASKNVNSAATLTTARNINDTSFNGSSNINIPSYVEGVNPSDTAMYPLLVPANAIGNQSNYTDGGLEYNASTNTLTATTFSGALSGNADTVTTNANLTGDVTSVGNATTIAAGAVDTAELAANAVTGDKLTQSVASTGSQSITGSGGSWTPSAGVYQFGMPHGFGLRAEIQISGTWRTCDSLGFMICDGTNMRIYNGGVTTTVYYQKF